MSQAGRSQTAAAPGPLAPFGVTEGALRTKILDTISGGGDFLRAFVISLRRGYDRLSAAARGPATAAAFTWTRTFTSSAAFATAYARLRAGHTPAAVAAPVPIDEAVKTQIATQIAQLEEQKKVLAALPPPDRANMTAGIDETIAKMRNPGDAKQLGALLENEARDKAERGAKAAADFAANWPASPNAFVRTSVERFMTATANIDYAMAAFVVKSPAGETLGFLSPGLTSSIAPETIHAVLAGKSAVDAARAVCESWLKDLK